MLKLPFNNMINLKMFKLSHLWICFILIISFISLWFVPQNPNLTDAKNRLQPPSLAHFFGTDSTGRDVFSVLFSGTKVTVLVAVSVVVLTAFLGLLFALLSKRFLIVALIIDVLIAIPTILTACVLAAALGGSLTIIIISTSLSYSVILARVLRQEIIRIENSEFFSATVLTGKTKLSTFFTHSLANLLPILKIQLSIAAGTAILAEAGLTYLGFGAPLNTVSWGQALVSSLSLIHIAPLVCFWPGLVIAITVFALHRI